ncbi:uncharacterized protein At5g41620 [Malania oleifera]|uniref:uncharacterized protein At5g41620 n=1 Tax=Malania oleifera TaxID=397392 RepID=UPI0025AE2F21|nr:uncharacterized protein At5g41620 [Malania oleifera]
MPRHNHGVQGLIPGSCKTRKRGCSSSSSSSSVLQNYRFKRAILIGKPRGGSRSSTPAPSWRLVGSRSPASALRIAESPKYAPSPLNSKPRGPPVSARKLAATLWEMNEIPSPRVVEEKRVRKEVKARERAPRSVHSGSLPPHLSDPSHSPVSDRMDRSGTGSRRRRALSISQRLMLTDQNVGVLDSVSNASFMEIETRSRGQTPRGSTVGVKTRLKDVSNALTTSKELLKIINRIWGHEDQPSSSMSLISALHAELERARLQVNQLIQEQRSDQNEINYLMKCFAEEKAAWKNKEHEVIEAAIESIGGELEVERKLRRRFESLNKKIGRELAETKSSLSKAVKELENEKRSREIMEQVCNDLAGDIGENKAEVEELKRESAKIRDDVEKEREMLQLADVLREEKVQMKLAEAKYNFEEKNAAVDKLRNDLEAFMRTKRAKEKAVASINHGNNGELVACFGRTRFGYHWNDEKEDGEMEDGVECDIDSAESDLHSIELNMDNNNSKSYKWTRMSGSMRDSRKVPIDEIEIKGRKSTSGKVSRRSTSLQRSISDGVEWGGQAESLRTSGDGWDCERFSEVEKQAQIKVHGDEMQRYRSAKGLRDQVLSRLGSAGFFASPTRQWGQSLPQRDTINMIQESPTMLQGSGLKPRLVEAKGEGPIARRSKR